MSPPVRARPFEPSIQQRFLENFDRSRERESLDGLIAEVEGRRSLTASQHESARLIVGGLRRMLARAAVRGDGAGPGNPGRVSALSGSA